MRDIIFFDFGLTLERLMIMSQQKVEQYKKDKANRKKILAREKFRTRVAGCAVGIVCLAIVGYIGYSVYDYQG